MHHPYESFGHVVDFIEAAANDDRVLAIKQTLYRTSSDSPIVRALQRAADNGKQVTAVIELKARLDEERNILWSRELEKSGVHVVFGFIGLKTHCKVALVVRREDDGIRRYVHLATGNYNPQTARIYTDLGFFTCNPEFCDDVSALFNYLTGYSELPQWRKLVVAPSRMQAFMIEKIEQRNGIPEGGRRPHHRQDQRPARTGDRAGPVSRQPGGREDRYHLPRHLRPAARHCRASATTSASSRSSIASSSTAASSTSATAAIRRSTSARPTGWTAISAGGLKWSGRSTARPQGSPDRRDSHDQLVGQREITGADAERELSANHSTQRRYGDPVPAAVLGIGGSVRHPASTAGARSAASHPRTATPPPLTPSAAAIQLKK